MIGGGGCFLPLQCFGPRKSEPKLEPDRDPVLLVSGIGGSILHAKNKKLFGLQTRVWVRIFLSDLMFREKLISLYNPDTVFKKSSKGEGRILGRRRTLKLNGTTFSLNEESWLITNMMFRQLWEVITYLLSFLGFFLFG